MYGLDTTKPEVLAHLERTAAALVEMGFTYLKVDFAFAPSVDGIWSDTSHTPAERVRAGFAALRRGAGDGAFILGCGVPLSHVVGLVDANRIGQDVAPLWALPAPDEIIAGYLEVQPATKHAYANTVDRSFMHRQLWLNDPDCVMLRTRQTDLSAGAATTWAQVVGLSGGMALVSDDLSLLDEASRRLFDEVVSFGRVSDAGSSDRRAGRRPRPARGLATSGVRCCRLGSRHRSDDRLVGTSTFNRADSWRRCSRSCRQLTSLPP